MRGLRIFAGPALAGILVGTANAQGITVYVNGDPVSFTGAGPRQLEGRVMVPLRGVMEKMGAYVSYLPESKTVIASKGDVDLQLKLGESFAMVNGQRKMLDVPAQSYLGSTMVPLRFMSEALGAQVQWDAPSMAVRIVTETASTPPVTTPPQNTQPERPQPIRGTRIRKFDADKTGFGRTGEQITFTLEGTRGGEATMEIPGVIAPLRMAEVSPGKYQAIVTVPQNAMTISKANAIARLKVGADEQVRQSTGRFMVDTQPPVFRDPFPEGNSRISKAQPNITVSFEDLNGSGIDTDQVRISVDGKDVTRDANISSTAVFYRPGSELAPGQHNVRVAARDKAGNYVEREWSFTVGRTRDTADTLTHNGARRLRPGQVVKFTVRGEPGSSVTYSIGDKIMDLPTREVSSGVYEGEYTVKLEDDLAGTPVIARLRNRAGEIYTVEASQMLGEIGPPMKPSITSPDSTRAVGANTVNIKGKAGRRAKVMVTVDYESNLLGLFPVKGTLAERTVFADENGNWETGDINLNNSSTGSGTTFKVTATAMGKNNQNSEATTLTFRK